MRAGSPERGPPNLPVTQDPGAQATRSARPPKRMRGSQPHPSGAGTGDGTLWRDEPQEGIGAPSPADGDGTSSHRERSPEAHLERTPIHDGARGNPETKGTRAGIPRGTPIGARRTP